MSQVLGIDIGSYTIKFAFLELEKSKVTLKDVIEIAVPVRQQEDELKLAKIQAIKQALAGVDLSRIQDNIYAGLGSQHAVLQNFEFLKVTRKYLPKVIENEFDDLGLFSLKDYIIEHSILERSSKQTRALGILIKKSAAKSLIEVLTNSNLTCRTIDLNCLALQNLLPYIPRFHAETESGEVALNFMINIGHKKTSVIVFEKNKVILERSFNLAGHYITSKIQEACSVSYQEAEELKHKVSTSIEFNSDNSKLAKDTLVKCVHEIAHEIQRVVLSLKQHEQDKAVHSITLTGGTSKFVDIAKIVQEVVGVKTEKLAFSDENFTNSSEIEHVYESFGQAIALALRATGAKTNSHINIRHGELALASDYEALIDKILSYTKLAAVILVCFLATYWLRAYLYNHKINQIKNLFNAQVVSYFQKEPLELLAISSKSNWNFTQYSNKAWDVIDQTYEQKKQFINNTLSQSSMMPLVVLNEISASIPKSVYFEVSHYNYKDGVLALTADTDSKDALEDILKRLSEIKLFANVQKKSETPKPGTDGKLITFSILATLSSKEST